VGFDRQGERRFPQKTTSKEESLRREQEVDRAKLWKTTLISGDNVLHRWKTPAHSIRDQSGDPLQPCQSKPQGLDS
jgi:hypothetical protein